MADMNVVRQHPIEYDPDVRKHNFGEVTEGFDEERASPLTAATPIRIPVKDPGPALTQKASMSSIFKSA